nr:transposase (putative), gypsy type [Tanacetum cinerariifolium]
MGRDTVQLETAVNTISHEYLLEFTSEYGIPETLHPELPGQEDRIVDFPEGKVGVYTRFFEFANFRFPLSQFLFGVLGVPSTIERSPLDFALEDGASDQGIVAPEMPPSEDVPATDVPGAGQAEETVATDPPAAPESRKKGRDGTDINAPPKSLRIDYADPRPSGSSHGGKSLTAIQLGLASTVFLPEDAPAGVSDPDPLSSQGTAAAGDPESENASFSVEPIQRQLSSAGGNGVTAALEIRTGGKVAEEVCCSGGSPGQKDSGPGARNKKPGSITGGQDEYEESRERQECWAKLRIRKYVSGEEKLKAAFEEFKRQQDERVEQRCVEMDARLDALSIDFDEELYPHMLTAITGRRWVIGRGLRLAVMKYGESLELRQAFADVVSARIAKGLSEGLRLGLEHGQAQLSLESIKAYDPKAEAKFVAALQALKDLKYPLVVQLEGLKDAPMDVIMAALYLESDTRDDAPQDIRDLRPSSSQLTIPVYPEVRDPRNPWACKEEMVLADAIAANISRTEKKKMPHSVPYSWGWLCAPRLIRWRPCICTHCGPPGSCPFIGEHGHTDGT